MPSKHRRNPPPPAPRRRPGPPSKQRVSTSLARVRQIAKSLPERERPFDPSRRGSWQGSSRDLVVNGRGTVRYVYAGQVERGVGGGRYEWRNGYSEEGRMQPWLTKREAQAEAKSRGLRAVFEDDHGGMKRNGDQQHFPWGSKRAGRLEIPAVDFDWEQVDGDVSLPTHGGIIARCDGGQIDLIEIQPVREYVGEGEAAEVGFPFWIREASFDVEDLDPTEGEVRKACESSELDLDDIDPEHRATAIAVALMRYGHAEEADGGWAGDKQPGEEGRGNVLGGLKVRWGYAGVQRKTFAEEASDEDDEFRREVLGEEEDD